MVIKLTEERTKNLLNELRNPMSKEFLLRFNEAFQDECRDPNEYIALPPGQRVYYLVYHNSRHEALFGINFNENQKPTLSYSISSFARIIKKDINTAPGWWYLKEVIERILLPKCVQEGVKFIFARLNKGSREAFEQLKKRNPIGYNIDVERYSGKIEVML